MQRLKVRFTGSEDAVNHMIDIIKDDSDFVICPVWTVENVSKPYPNRESDDVRVYCDFVMFDSVAEIKEYYE